MKQPPHHHITFYRVPRDVWALDLSVAERAVIAALAAIRGANPDGASIVLPAVRTIADIAHISEGHCRRVISHFGRNHALSELFFVSGSRSNRTFTFTERCSQHGFIKVPFVDCGKDLVVFVGVCSLFFGECQEVKVSHSGGANAAGVCQATFSRAVHRLAGQGVIGYQPGRLGSASLFSIAHESRGLGITAEAIAHESRSDRAPVAQQSRTDRAHIKEEECKRVQDLGPVIAALSERHGPAVAAAIAGRSDAVGLGQRFATAVEAGWDSEALAIRVCRGDLTSARSVPAVLMTRLDEAIAEGPSAQVAVPGEPLVAEQVRPQPPIFVPDEVEKVAVPVPPDVAVQLGRVFPRRAVAA